ncbi:putative vitellogenin receptor [Topomyia yanbarensis]|uniref:putative vitellogenin receptor n=1 Tax=Topomyia yanbarensis TaxID=2498891 RepID=UPI00273CBEEE|nr:putative vitellogenin receptor [Topomyia yanbarensis]XP_058833969.1 putative vitellogenin receptor [Topomyia yanbarensis]
MLRSRSSVVQLITIGSVICAALVVVDAARKGSKITVTCSEDEFQCDSGACIPKEGHCNGNKDCSDGSDEAGCDFFLCLKPMWYRCKHDNSCISASFLCDKHDDCPLGDDEENCENFEVPHVPVPCSKYEFTCTDKMCIPVDLVCDGTEHCLDGSDETIGCMDIESKCKGFLCKNKHCLKSHDWVCDGIDDCGDGSDEENCLAACDLEHGKFECADNRTCIDLKQLCDGKDDCGDRSDEGALCSSKECDELKCPEGCQNTPHGAVCLCKVGFVFSRKTKTCEDINECDRYGLCSQGCENTPGSFNCTCVSKFTLQKDGRTCELSEPSEALLLYSTQKSIGALYLTSKHQYYVAKDLSQVIGVSYDGSHVYWTDISFKTESIERAEEDGSKRELLLTSGLASPEDLALDWLTGNIYFSDSGHMMIAVCSNDGFHCKMLIQDNLHKPRGIALLPQKAIMFYSDWGNNAMIGTASMDGKSKRVLIDTDIHWPNGLSLDWPNERLYWVDAKLKKIESVRLDGSQRRTVISDVVKHPFSISVYNDRLYWSDWDTKSIQSCDKFNGKDRKTLVHDRQIFDVHVYHSSIQPKGDHACLGHTCSHLCLLAPNNSYSCACPYGMALKPDKHSCQEMVKRQYLLMGIGNYLVRLDIPAFGRHETSKGDAFQFTISRMVFNSITGELFVADNIQKVIFTVDIKAKTSRKLITTGIGNISALAFDYLGNNMYWSDSERSTVEVFSLQTHHRSIIQHYLGTEFPIGLAIIPEIGKMFIALRSADPDPHTHIDRQDMTGRGPHNHIIEEKLSGNGTFNFVVDRDLRSVYWNDMGLSRIEFTSFEGDTRHLFREYLRMPVSIAIVEDNLFWTCYRSRRLYWSDKHNLGLTKKINIEKPPFGIFPDEIVLLASQPLQRYDHPCQKQNGGCSHICIAAGMYASACICPTGMIFSSPKNTTCIDAIDCEFKCTSGECLTISKRCNGNKDCADGSDEKGCDERERTASLECSFDQFMCADRSKCIDQKLRCDKHNDCTDRSDEKNCEGYDSGKGCHENQHACPDGLCIDLNALCDGFPDCTDGSDEKDCTNLNNEKHNATTCGPLMFRCSSGQCIPNWWECDGHPDCADSSDEHDKCLAKSECPKGFTKCALGHCVEDRLVCDGNNDCGDNSDEMNCKVEAEPCVGLEEENPTKFLCPRSGKCLDIAVRCNGTSECPNGEDEADCTNCGIHEFQCKNGQCIRKEWQCDKEVDCDDGSDEVDCVNGTTGREKQFYVACGEGSFECNPGVCIQMSKVCDGKKDCVDGKDEGKGCDSACSKNPCEHKCIKTPTGPVCDCRVGFTLAGNRKSCLDIDECAERKPCAQICRNTRGSFRCSCNPGFMLRSDKISCKAVGPSRYILYTSYNQIRKLEVRPPSIRVLLQTNESSITDMDVDVRRQMLYYTDEYSPVIYEYDLVHNTTLALRNVGHPNHLAVDWITGNLYFFDNSEPSIKLCSIQRQACARLITFPSQVFIKALTIDPINHVLFYAQMHFWIFEIPHSIIYRANLDGSHQQIVTKNVAHVTSLECDTENRILYMIDMNTKSIKMIDYDGKNLRTVVEKQTLAINRPIGFTVYENQALVLNMASSTVGQCKLYGDYECKLLELNKHNSNQLLIVQESRQPMAENICDAKKINCSLICIPSENGGKCICHNGEHVREGDICPQTSQDMTPHITPHLRIPSASLANSSAGSTGSSFTNIFVTLLIVALLVGAVGYYYKRRYSRKFSVGMHFHNPELSTLDAAQVKMFQGPPPRLNETVTHTELTLETTPPSRLHGAIGGCGGSFSGGTDPSLSDTQVTARHFDITTTAIELENMSDADSMKDAYSCEDDLRQRLIM